MSKYNNYDITSMYYSGYTIVRAYGCGGELVFGEEPYVPPFTDKFRYTNSGRTRTIACNSSTTLTYLEIVQDMYNMDRNAYISGMTEGIVGDCVTTIEENCFNQWVNVTSITISSSVTTIGHDAFDNCEALPSLVIPSGVTVIPSHMCNGCIRMASTNIPSGATSIGVEAYYDCLSLLNITIPASVTSIGDDAFRAEFYSAQSLEAERRAMMLNMAANRSVTVLATTPPSLGTNVFSVISGTGDITTYPIYVPAESLEAYKTATNWSVYANRIFPIE